MYKVSNNRSNCPVSSVLDLMGDCWSSLIVRDLFMQRTTFSDFLAAPEKIFSNIQTDRLQKLKGYQIIDYTHDPKNRKIKKYFLTDVGIDLYPIICEMSSWSKKHLDMEFHSLSLTWFMENENNTLDQIIENDTQSYIAFRKKIKKSLVG